MVSDGSTVLRVAVIGCGEWGRNHIRVWRELGHLAAVVDLDADRARSVAAALPGVEAMTFDQAIAHDDIDAVVVATPAPTHAEIAMEAMKAGKDALVEKPMATAVADCELLVRTAEDHARVLMVGHVLEFHPVVERLRALVAGGELGRLRYLYSNRLNFGRVRTEENALWSFAPHDVAIFLRLTGALPTEVTAQGGAYLNAEVADTTTMEMAFPGGVRGHIFVSWLHPFKEHRLVVIGERQMAVFDDGLPWDRKLQLYPHEVNWIDGRVPVASRAAAVAVDISEAEPLRRECEHFVACIAERARPLTDGHSGLAVLRVLHAGSASLAARGGPVRGDAAVAENPRRWFAHDTAVIDDGAHIGDGSAVWHFSHVMSGARIGAGSSLGQNSFVGRGVRIGDGVRVQNNVSIYEGVELRDHVFCGPSVVFTNVVNPRSEVQRKHEYRPTTVERGASLGANSTIVCGVTIGEYAMVGAGAIVTHDVPAHALVVGVPARVVGFVCRCGGRLADEGAVRPCSLCGTRYAVDETGARAVGGS